MNVKHRRTDIRAEGLEKGRCNGPQTNVRGLFHRKDLSLYIEKEGCEDLIDSQILTAFLVLRKPPALPVEVPRKKALASSFERSELLIAMS